MTISPSTKRLGEALRAVTSNGDAGKVVALAREYEIDGRKARQAAQNIDVDASSHLKLCAAIGIDPVSGKILDINARGKIPEIDWNRFATKVLLALIDSEKTMRQIAKAWGIPLVILARAKAQQPVNTENFLRICKALQQHPHQFTKQIPAELHVKQSPEQPERVNV